LPAFALRSTLRRAFFLASLLTFYGAAQGQILNMSHDLVTLGIASQNLAPNNPDLDARPLIEAAAQYAQNNHYQTLTLDRGNYYLLSNQQANGVLLINVSNMTIDFAGSTLYFTGPLLPNGITLYQCSHVTLTNLQTDFLNPPYTHVQLTSVDTANRLLYYQALAGWPDPTTFNGLTSPFGDTVNDVAAFFRNGAIIPGTSRTQLAGPFSNDTLAITDPAPWAQAATLATLQAGDTVVVTTRAAGPPILIWESDSVTFSNAHVYGSGQWAVEIYYSSNTTVDNVSVEPRPVTGLIGSNADGIHFTYTLQNDHIRNSYVARTMDDALIMDTSEVATLVNQPSPTQLTVVRNGTAQFPQGALMSFIDPGSTLVVASAHIVSQNPPFSNNPGYGAQVALTFDQSLPTLAAGVLMVYGDPANRGQGSTIEDNTVVDTDGGRGIWINGVDGVTVERNVLLRTSMAGIIVENDTSIYQAGPATNVVIQSNALESSPGAAACGTGVQFCVGAIETTTDGLSFAFAPQPSNTNITVQNNYIADSGRSGIWMGDVNGGTIQNNVILRYSQNPTLNGTFGIPTQALADLVTQNALLPLVTPYSTGIATTNNTIDAISTIADPVAFTPASAMLSIDSATGSFGVQTVVSNFDWRAASDSGWLAITSGGAGPGAGTVQFAVTANTTGTTRSGNITIAGVSFQVLQTILSSQSIAFGALSNVAFGIAPFIVSATASSGLPVSFTSSTPSVCTVSGSTVTIVATGTCSVVASQAGSATYAAAISVTQSFSVAYQLSIAVSPVNSGAVMAEPASPGNYYSPGSVVCLTAAPASGEIFIGWTGAALNSAGCLTINSNVSVTANFAVNPISSAGALRFVPAIPCRLVDTRNADGALGGPSLSAGETRSFTIPGTCGIPPTALAYSLNLTVAPHGTLGYVTLWAAGQVQPVVSTLNSLDGRIKSNAAVVPAGAGGGVSVYATDATDAILDINGYFVSYTDPAALQFYALTPCRVADTRGAVGTLGGPSLVGGQTRMFPVVSSACNVPNTALAYSLNFTAIPAGFLGYLSVWPDGESQPLVSTLNAVTGAVTANAAIVPAGTDGAIELFVTNNADMAIDINGYFAPPGNGGLSLYNLTPCRIEDTRQPAGMPPFTGTIAVTATGAACGVPPEAQSLVLNATVVPSGILGYLSLWAYGGSQPVVSTLNSLDGSLTSNMAVVPTGNGLINAYAAGPGETYLILDISGYFAP
jgi:hypothetical protein